ncbi:hypothetical protein AX16_010725 [Volvariella volvacea WC 439]|nr:hypothetical protein AX16_010725 [Volvariella volvacea WC 439]
MSIVNDTIVTHEGSFDLTPREDNVRDAMLIMRIAAPIIASVIIWIFSPKGWSYSSAWTFNRLAIIWFWSVGIVGLWVHFQERKTTRATLVLAILHTQVEVLINSLLLGLSLGKAATLAGIWGLITYPPTLMVPSMKVI